MAQSAVELHRRSEGAGRVPPHNLEAEESLLGAMLLSRDAIATAVEGVKAEDFYKPAHAHVFDAILALYSSGEPVDPVTVSEELRRAGLLDAIGGKATILQIQAATPASANAGHYAKIVEELALLRRLIGVAGEIAEMGYELPDDVTSTLDRAEAMVFEVAERRVTDSLVNVHDVLQQALDQLEALYGRDVSITGLPTGFADLDDLLLGLQPSALVVIAARPAMGKCVAWDTPIVDPRTGDLRTAAEVHRRGEVGADVEVFSLDDDLRLATAVPSDFVDDGIKPVFRVRTRLGREVRTTATHPFLTLDGWEPLERLRPGDRIAVPREIPVFGNDVLPDEEVCLLAYLIGDGCVRRSSPLLSTASPLVLDDARRCAEAMGATVRHAGGYDYRFATERGRPNPVLDLVRRHGLAGKGAHDKRIPRAIFRLARRQVARFLNRLFATDGTAYVASPGFAEISYSTVSRRLALDVQHLLLRFGINARLRERSVAYGDTRRTAYEVILRDAGSLQAFAAEIGIFGKEEAVAAVSENAAAKRSQPSNLDTLPRATWELVDEIRADGEWSWADVSRAAGRPSNHNWHAGRRSPRRATVGALAEAMRSTDLALLATSAIWWDEIVSIEYDGLDQVYDLTVPRDHNFVAGDVFVHNTSLALGAALHVAVSEQRPALVFSLEMGHLELTQRLLAAEARVDSKKLRTGRMQDADWTRIAHAVGRLGEAPLFIDDNPHCSVMEMRAKARRIKARQGDLGLIVVDYLQLMSSPHSRAESRQVEVSELSRGLKILAREMETPVLALSQLNRSPEYRQDKRPMLADLRESGCLTADTTITRADTGETVTLGELLARGERNIPVWTVDDDLRVVEGVMTHVFASGVKPVYRLRLRSGLEVKASPNHPFLTFDGWRRLDQLERGERLAVPRRVPEPARPARWRQSEVTVLAHLLGAGDLDPDRPIRDVSADRDHLNTVEWAAAALGARPQRVRRGPVDEILLAPALSSCWARRDPLVDWLFSIGVRLDGGPTPGMPSCVSCLSPSQLALFLRHLWAAGGRVSSEQGVPVFTYLSANAGFLADLQRLLFRFGVLSQRRTVEHPGGAVAYELRVTAERSRRRFVAEIGLPSGAPGGWATALDAGSESAGGVARRTFRSAMGETYWGPTLPQERAPSALAALLDDDATFGLVQSDLAWDAVESIEYLGEMPVYDATVPGTHNFVADGIVVHNSIEQDADVVAFIYRDDVYNPESQDRGTAEIIVAKHRNGPTGTVRLAFLEHLTKFENMARVD